MKSVFGERFQFHANRKAALQFRNQIARLRDMKGARGDEQDVIGAHEAVARVDRGAFHDRQDVALHAFAADVGTVAAFAAGDFVDFVQKDDAVAFHALERDARHLIHVDQLLLFFLHQVFEGFGHAHFALARALPKQPGHDILEIDVHLFDVAVGGDLERRPAFFDVDFHHAVVEFAGAQLLAQLLARALGAFARFRLRRHQQIEQPLFGLRSARSATSSSRSSRTMSMAMSTRSRIIDSTSRPT